MKKKGNSYIKLDDKGLKKDLAEGDATVSLATRKKIQTQLLTELFTAYFRILKQQKNAKILPVVLRGLSKFATLIDIELVLDLLDCLKATISPDSEEPLTLDSTLYCILTSFQTLQSHGGTLNMDLKEVSATEQQRRLGEHVIKFRGVAVLIIYVLLLFRVLVLQLPVRLAVSLL